MLRSIDLEDIGAALVGGVKDESDEGLEEAYRLGLSIG